MLLRAILARQPNLVNTSAEISWRNVSPVFLYRHIYIFHACYFRVGKMGRTVGSRLASSKASVLQS